MAIYQHFPAQPLREFIDWCWYYVDFQPDHEREHVLPDGTFELIINLQESPRKLFDASAGLEHRAFQRAWFSGTQKSYLVIDALPGSTMIGVHFKPGGAAPFLGMPASELCGQVVELEILRGTGVNEWREKIAAAPSAPAKFELLEQMLLSWRAGARIEERRRRRAMYAVERFVVQPQLRNLGALAAELGCSHKHFIDQFQHEVGLTPKSFCRIRRFQQVLAQLRQQKPIDWAQIVADCGFYDQAHLVNDFQAFSGVNPSSYLNRCLAESSNFLRA